SSSRPAKGVSWLGGSARTRLRQRRPAHPLTCSGIGCEPNARRQALGADRCAADLPGANGLGSAPVAVGRPEARYRRLHGLFLLQASNMPRRFTHMRLLRREGTSQQLVAAHSRRGGTTTRNSPSTGWSPTARLRLFICTDRATLVHGVGSGSSRTCPAR